MQSRVLPELGNSENKLYFYVFILIFHLLMLWLEAPSSHWSFSKNVFAWQVIFLQVYNTYKAWQNLSEFKYVFFKYIFSSFVLVYCFYSLVSRFNNVYLTLVFYRITYSVLTVFTDCIQINVVSCHLVSKGNISW